MSTTFTASIEHIHHTTSRVTVRSHHLLVDRSRAKDGFDLGPAGGEYMLVSLGGCLTTHVLAAIRTRQAPMTNVRVEVAGTMDGSPEKFVAFAVRFSADCDDEALARKLITIGARGCQVMSTLRQVVPITITYRDKSIDL